MRFKRFLSYFLLPAIFLVGCNQIEEKHIDIYAELEGTEDISEPILTVQQTTSVIRGDVLEREFYSGILTPYVEELCFPAEGVFGSFNVTLGQEVKAGEVLAVTDIESSQARLDILEEQLQNLEDNYTYQMAMFQNQVATLKLELEECYALIDTLSYPSKAFSNACTQAGLLDGDIQRTELKMRHYQEDYDFEKPYLETQIKELKKEMKNNIIKAPFDGVVVQLSDMLKGDRFEKNKPCIVIADTQKCCAVSDYLPMQTAQKALKIEVFVDGQTYSAIYQTLDSEIYSDLIQKSENPYSTYLLEEQDLAENYGYGHSVLIVVTKNMAEDVLVVSNLGIIRDGSQYYCYVDRAGKKEKVFITIGLRDDIHTEIVSGLEEGDVVYIED